MNKKLEISLKKLAIIFVVIIAFVLFFLSFSIIKHRSNTEISANLGVTENVRGDKKQA